MKKINIIVLLFYTAYFLLTITNAMSMVSFMGNTISILYNVIPLMLMFIIIIQSKTYQKKSMLIIIISIVFTILSFFKSDNRSIFLLFLFIIACKNIDFNNFIKCDIKFKIIILIMVFILYKLGIAESVVMYRDDGTIRYALGLGHPNTLGAYLFTISAEFVFLKYNKFKLFDYIFLVLCLIGSIFICDSRGAEIGILIFIIFIRIMPKIENNKETKLITRNLFLILTLLSYFVTILYINGNSLMIELNELLNHRIKSAANFYQYYGFTLFGSEFTNYGIYNQGLELTILDNAYMNLILQFGIVPMTLITLLLNKSIKHFSEIGENKLIFCLSVFLIYGLMEATMYNVIFNPFIIGISYLIYNKKEVKL